MKRDLGKVSQKFLLLPILLLMVFGNPYVANIVAKKPQEDLFQLKAELKTKISKELCIGSQIDIEFSVKLEMKGYSGHAPPLIPKSVKPPRSAEVNFTKNKRGIVDNGKLVFYNVTVNIPTIGTFKYTAKTEGKEEIEILVKMGKNYKQSIPIQFEVKDCAASFIFNNNQTYAMDIYQFTTTYSGSGTLKVNDDGELSGNGTQRLTQEIPSWSSEGGTCTQTPAEGSSGLVFSGQFSEDENNVYVNFESLPVSSSTVTCHDEDGSGSMTLPNYTFSDCKVQLADFSFDMGTVDVPCDCPGQDPFSISITIIPRRQS